MEFMAYDDFVLNLISEKLNLNIKKFSKEIKTLRRIELLLNLKLRCMNVLFDNVIHSSTSFINKIKKQELEDIKKSFLDLYNNIFNDIFKKHLSYIKNTQLIHPNIITNQVNGNHGLLFGTIISIILAYSIFYLLTNKKENIDMNKFIFDLLENKEYSYKKIILDFISKNNINYFKLFIEKCLDITDENYNLYS
jgi:hypothetical protein